MTIITKKRKFSRGEAASSFENDFGHKYHCDACQKDISSLVRVKCHICADFDLCVECFCQGVELKDHKSDHDYRVMVCLLSSYRGLFHTILPLFTGYSRFPAVWGDLGSRRRTRTRRRPRDVWSWQLGADCRSYRYKGQGAVQRALYWCLSERTKLASSGEFASEWRACCILIYPGYE